MKYYTVIVRLEGALADVVALEWTNTAAPVDSGEGWEPCLRQPDGAWRFSSQDFSAMDQPHRREPGPFGDLAIRYRLSAAGPWSLISETRKEIVILAETEPGIKPAEPVEPRPIAPALIAIPVLTGAGKIGSEVTASPGFWIGAPAPDLLFQWRRDGADIAGARSRSYLPRPEDDQSDLDCVVTARNAAGEVVETTNALRVSYPAPAITGILDEEIFDEGVGPQSVETGHVFAGAALAFSAEGAEIDRQTGVLQVSTDRPVSGAVVMVTAMNSGGAVSAPLLVTVEQTPIVEVEPWALDATEMHVLRSVWRPEGQTVGFTPILVFPGLAGQRVDAIEWTTSLAATPLEQHWEIVAPRDGAPGEYELLMRDPALRLPMADPKVDYAVFGVSSSEIARSGRIRFRWRAVAAGAWSPPSAAASAPPPVSIGAIPAQEVVPGTTATLDLRAYATGSNLTYGLSAGAAASWITINPATGVLTLAPPRTLTSAGALAVTVTVADANNQSAAATLTLTVRNDAFLDAARLWRPLHFREKAIFDQPADHPKYYDRGRYWGEGLQYPHCFEREGDRIAFGGDMCGFRLSDDGGISWYWPRGATVASDGLRGCTFHAIGIDPGDRDVMLVATGPSIFSPNYPSGGYKAIYRTTDGGRTFAPVQAMENLTDRSNINLKLICCHRAVGTPTTRRWRFVENGSAASAQYWRSNDGGRSWAKAAAFPTALADATIYGVVQHPTQANTQFITSSAGLWRTSDDGATTAGWLRIGNASGKLSGSVRMIWIDPETPARMLASMAGSSGGVFYTANGGANGSDWTNVLPGAGDVSTTTLAVGPKDASNRRTIYVMNDRKYAPHNKPWIQHWLTTGAPAATKYGQLGAGASAPDGQWFLPRVAVAAAGVVEAHWNQICGIGQSIATPDPADVARCCAYGYGFPWRTANRGADWVQSNAGFGGMNSQGIAFDASNVNRMLLALNDVQAAHTENLPDFIEEAKVLPAQRTAMQAQVDYEDSGAHGKHGVIVPSHSLVPSAKRGRLIASIGNYKGGQQIYCKNRTASGWDAEWTEVTTVIGNVPEFFMCGADPNVIYAGALRSLNAGDSFQSVLGRKCCGVSQQNPAIVFATDDDQAIQRSVSYGGTSGTVNGVSGAAWTTWFSGSRKKAAVERKTFFWLSPHDHTKAVVQSDAGDLVLVEGEATGRIKCEMNLAGAYGALGYAGVLPINVACADWCPLDPQRFYFHAKMFGRPMVWRATFSADFTRVEWEDISRNAPSTANNRQLKTHPLTGEVFISSGGGIWCLPAPGALHSQGVWSRLPQPFPTPGAY
jgi:hypothetical protein